MQLQSNRVTGKDTEGTIDSVCVNGVTYVNYVKKYILKNNMKQLILNIALTN